MRPLLIAGAAAAALASAPAGLAQPMDPDMPGMAPAPATPLPAPDQDMQGLAGMDHGGMAGMSGMSEMAYKGVQGFYPVTRDASGTSWQPDASQHGGVHAVRGDWMLMGHLTLNGVVDRQNGPRGDRQAFVAGMAMGAARRDFDNGDTVNLRAMLSPDPLMGPRGYPLLLAAGETADGRTLLTDRQHPHDLVMELSGSYSRRLTIHDSLFVYAGLPGEPAFGPPAFMHRLSGQDTPEAPITHHWLDSTHITFGVVTAGYVHDDWKVEASAFRGREPDEHRYDIEAPKLDSSAVRLSWNPTSRLALQTSWARLTSPEALDPDHDETRWSASGLYTLPVGEGLWATTAAWGRKTRTGGEAQDAWLLESAFRQGGWTLFGRAERIETDELSGGGHGAMETVGRTSVGAIRDFRLAGPFSIGFGAQASWTAVPPALEPRYGGDPAGGLAFVRLKVG